MNIQNEIRGRRAALAAAVLLAIGMLAGTGACAQTCPTEVPSIDSAKSNKLFLYFPTSADASFPAYATNVSPAQPFSVADLDASIGTTAQLIDEITHVVIDDYCEFNVQVLATTSNPATLANPPARRSTVAIGSDANSGNWGGAQEVDTGDNISIDFARVWAGTYVSCEGGNGPTGGGGCSSTGALAGANSTLEHWGQAIGGTAAHEAGHTYGLAHTDDDPPNDPSQAGPGPAPGEDAFNRHLMPAGYNLTGTDRADYRRHFSNRDYGILASNVGLSIETMHNWDLVNPNAQSASSLAIDFLSPLPAITIAWFYNGSQSPWLNPTVSGPNGTAVWKGTTYNKFRITWSAANPAWNNSAPGVVSGGAVFHIGATFVGVDFNQPDPIIIQDVTLLDASSSPLALQPRLPSYDAGTLDAASGNFELQLDAPRAAPNLRMVDATILQLPRIASIDAMVGDGRPYARDKIAIEPWSSTHCKPGALREGLKCTLANASQRPHVQIVHSLGQAGVIDCSRGAPTLAHPGRSNLRDSSSLIDYEGPMCAGTQRDPFPSTTVYLIATFEDPQARHFDPATQTYVVGPLRTKLFYQFAGIRKLESTVCSELASCRHRHHGDDDEGEERKHRK